MTDLQRTRIRAGFCVGVVIVGAVLAWLALGFDLGGSIDHWIRFFRGAGPLIFFGAMAFLPMVGFPVWPFTVAAGPVFGPSMGALNVILCANVSVATNMAICYWLSATALRPLAKRVLARLGYAEPRLPAGAIWEATLLVRLIPGPPLFLQSYLLGLARVPFRIYMTVSVLVHITYITGTVLTGNGLMRGDARSMLFGGALCAAGALAGYRVRKSLKTTPAIEV